MDFEKDIVLENSRVKIEPMGLVHLDRLLPIATNNPDLLKYSPSAFGTKEFLQNSIDEALAFRKNKIRYAFVIFDKLLNCYVGSTSYGNISEKDKRLEIGWTWIDKQVQGTGLNRNCKHLLLTHAFYVLGMQRVEFKTDSRNTA